MLTTPLAFVFVLGIIIFVHEFGHLITAKAFGMRVFVFSFGFGKRLAGFKWGDTDCRISAIPLGGYVKLEGEPDDHLSQDTAALGDGRDFAARPRWQKFLVYLAGPTMNAVLTITVLTVLFYTIGAGVDASRYDRPVVGALDPGSPAEAAGMKPGDEILSIDGEAFPTWETVYYHVLLRPDRALTVKVRRAGRSARSGSAPWPSGPRRSARSASTRWSASARWSTVSRRRPPAFASMTPSFASTTSRSEPSARSRPSWAPRPASRCDSRSGAPGRRSRYRSCLETLARARASGSAPRP